jgi:phosphatidylserine/phosphatidylglycerophosphate/cardiolipin synthase-like enzyme
MLDLAGRLEHGALGWPPPEASLHWLGHSADTRGLAELLSGLAVEGQAPGAIGFALRLLAEERAELQRTEERFQLVWTGPEVPGSRSRDTGVVVRELFSSAQRSVLVSTFAIYQGQQVFKTLVDRMGQRPELKVRLFVNVSRPHQNQASEGELVRAFAESFRKQHWPGEPFPEVYYDRRALALEPGSRSSLHAKCIIVDDDHAFVSSANFTEAAHERNIEAGVLVKDAGFASALRQQFDALVLAGELSRVPGL